MSHAKLSAGLGAFSSRLLRWRMFSVPFVLILVLALGGAALVGAANNFFEIDGNTADNAAPGVDWAQVIPGPHSFKAAFPVAGFLIQDPHSKKA